MCSFENLKVCGIQGPDRILQPRSLQTVHGEVMHLAKWPVNDRTACRRKIFLQSASEMCDKKTEIFITSCRVHSNASLSSPENVALPKKRNSHASVDVDDVYCVPSELPTDLGKIHWKLWANELANNLSEMFVSSFSKIYHWFLPKSGHCEREMLRRASDNGNGNLDAKCGGVHIQRVVCLNTSWLPATLQVFVPLGSASCYTVVGGCFCCRLCVAFPSVVISLSCQVNICSCITSRSCFSGNSSVPEFLELLEPGSARTRESHVLVVCLCCGGVVVCGRVWLCTVSNDGVQHFHHIL